MVVRGGEKAQDEAVGWAERRRRNIRLAPHMAGIAGYVARCRRSHHTNVTITAATSQIPSNVVPVGSVQKAR